MKRIWVNFVIDVMTAFAGFAMIATGALLEWVLPAHSRQSSVWGLTRHEWGDLHFWVAIAMIGLIVAHVLLHWTWVCTMISRCLPGHGRGTPSAVKRFGAAVVTGAVLVSLVAGWLWWAEHVKVLDPRCVPTVSGSASQRHAGDGPVSDASHVGPRQHRGAGSAAD